MKEKKCWICGRTAEQVAKDLNDTDLDPKFALVKEGKQYICLECELLIEGIIDNHIKEKFSRGQ